MASISAGVSVNTVSGSSSSAGSSRKKPYRASGIRSAFPARVSRQNFCLESTAGNSFRRFSKS